MLLALETSSMKISSVAAALLASAVRAALFTSKDAVKNLDGLSFDAAVLNNPYSTSMVAFTAPWCGHCQRLTSHFNQAAESLDGMVSFYNVVSRSLSWWPRRSELVLIGLR